MDVRMTDGTVIRDVPDGTTQAELLQLTRSLNAVSPTPIRSGTRFAELKQRRVNELLRAPEGAAQIANAGFLGVGRTFDRAQKGVRRLAALGVGANETARTLESRAAAGRGAEGPIAESFPVSFGLGQVAPALAIPGGQTLTGAAALGAVMGAAQPEGNPLANAAVGGTVGAVTQYSAGLLGNMIGGRGRITAPARREVLKSEDRVAGLTASQRAQKLGVQVPPRVETNSRVAAMAEANARTNMLTAGAFDNVDDKMAQQLNRVVLRRFGIEGRQLSGKLIKEIDDDIGEQFDAFADTLNRIRPTQAGPALARETDEAISFAAQLGAGEAAMRKQVAAVREATQGNLHGRDVHELLKKVRNFAIRARRSDNDAVAEVYDGLQAELWDAIQGGASRAQLRRLRKLRRDYRDVQILKDPAVLKNGRIQPGTLNSRLERSKFTRARYNAEKETGNLLWEVGRFGEQMQRQRIGSSGTAERSQNIFSAFAGAPFAVTGAMQTLSPRARAVIGGGLGLGRDATIRGGALILPELSGIATSRNSGQ